MNLFAYSFMVRALEAGALIALIAPMIGTFLVLRRYALIADTLAHASLAGVAASLLLKLNPLLGAFGFAGAASLLVEKLRLSRRVPGDAALSVFLSGSLAIAAIIISLAKGFNVNLFNYLFGSIVTVSRGDLLLIGTIGFLVLVGIALTYKELLFVSFDEEAAHVAGLPTKVVNLLLVVLAGLTVSIAIPIVGALLISALLVLPTLTALQLQRGFRDTLLIAEGVSLVSVITGIVISFYANTPAGGTIVLVLIALFVLSLLKRK